MAARIKPLLFIGDTPTSRNNQGATVWPGRPGINPCQSLPWFAGSRSPFEEYRMTTRTLQAALTAREFCLTAEVTPPLSCDPADLLAKAEPLAGLADAVNVTDGASARGACGRHRCRDHTAATRH